MSKRVILTITEELYGEVEKLAKKLGISPTEYVRFLILKSLERAKEQDLAQEFGL